MRPLVVLALLGYLLALLFVAGGGLAVWWNGERTRELFEPARAAEPVASAPPAVADARPPAVLARLEEAPERSADPVAPPPPEPGDPEGLRIEGWLLVTDERGVEHPAESGSFLLIARPRGAAPGHHAERTERISVQDGRWSARAMPDEELRAGPMEIGGRPAFAEEGALVLASAGAGEGGHGRDGVASRAAPEGIAAGDGAPGAAASGATGATGARAALGATGARDATGDVVATSESSESSETTESSEALVGDRAAGAGTAAAAEVLVRARWLPRSFLRVVDAQTGAELGGVEAAVLAGVRPELSHPGTVPPERVLVRGADSPVVLPDLLGVQPWWVRAPGFAWRRVDIDHRAGGERLVRLVPAGQVAIAVRGWNPSSAARVGVRAIEGEGPGAPVLEAAPDTRGRLLIEGLAAGRYEARVEAAGAPSAVPRPAGRGEARLFELAPGESLEVALALPSSAGGGERVPLEGELVLPAGWEGLEIALELAPLDEARAGGGAALEIPLSAMAAAEDGSLRWRAGPVAAGRWMASVRPTGVRQVFDVVPGEAQGPVRVVVPPPVSLRVVVRDGGSGEPVSGATVRWSASPPVGLASWEPSLVRAPPGSASLELLVPAGSLRLSVAAPGYAESNETLSLEPGAREHTVALRPRTGLRVTFLDGTSVVPCRDPRALRAFAIAGEGAIARWGTDGPACLLEFTGPGTYRLEFPPLEGFETPPPREVAVGAGPLAEVEVRLLRSP